MDIGHWITITVFILMTVFNLFTAASGAIIIWFKTRGIIEEKFENIQKDITSMKEDIRKLQESKHR